MTTIATGTPTPDTSAPGVVERALLARRSQGRLLEPAPGDAALRRFLDAASSVADHGDLRPWRVIALRGDARARLGAAMATGVDERAAAKAAGRPLRAPLLLSLVLTPVERPGVPEWEQLATAAGIGHALSLVLHDAGWGVMWRTGASTESPSVRAFLGLGPTEKLLGWLYVGTPDPDRPASDRPRPDTADRLSVLTG